MFTKKSMRVIDRFGRLDVLVNDAGVITVGPQKAMSDEDYRHAMRTNFEAAVRLVRAALPHLEKTGGAIVNIASIGGAVPVPHLLPYTASKFAMTGWSAGLAAELANNGVRVTTVLPWLMRTGSFLHAEVKGRQEKEARNFALSSSLPLLTLSAERAASRILLAVDRGERFVTVGVIATALRLAFALFPSTTIAALSLGNRLLPHIKETHDPAAAPASPLWKHRTGLAKSFLTRLGDLAARATTKPSTSPEEGRADLSPNESARCERVEQHPAAGDREAHGLAPLLLEEGLLSDDAGRPPRGPQERDRRDGGRELPRDAPANRHHRRTHGGAAVHRHPPDGIRVVELHDDGVQQERRHAGVRDADPAGDHSITARPTRGIRAPARARPRRRLPRAPCRTRRTCPEP